MYRLLIFGGTTEGRLLAEYCAENSVQADVSVATDYGASLLPEDVEVLCGRLDAEQMAELMIRRGYSAVIDATHPYAAEATANIRLACSKTGARYLRLVRESNVPCGMTVRDMEELVELLDSTEGTILSTLGSKSLAELTKVRDYRERIWVRVLPAEGAEEYCRELGYDPGKVIQEKGPFSTERNSEHIRMTGASYLVTKESGCTGGYPEKAEAAKLCGAELITLVRPLEDGLTLIGIEDIIAREMKE